MKHNAVYVSGPMTGMKDNNYPLFNKVADELKKAGYRVVNPAALDMGKKNITWNYCLRRDIIELVKHCRAVALLPGWTKSRGATLEVYTAKHLGMIVAPWKRFLKTPRL